MRVSPDAPKLITGVERTQETNAASSVEPQRRFIDDLQAASGVVLPVQAEASSSSPLPLSLDGWLRMFTLLGDSEETAEKAASEKKSAAEEFLEFARKTPAEKLRALLLAEMGLSEEDLQAMTPEDRQRIEDLLRERIEAKIKESVEQNTKLPIDIALRKADAQDDAFFSDIR